MNERIRKLKQQATDYVDSVDDGFGIEHYRELVDQKFAELIVRECARLAIEKQTENDVSGIVSKNPAKDFAYALVEHFGVEE
jgi:hypothetical protein